MRRAERHLELIRPDGEAHQGGRDIGTIDSRQTQVEYSTTGKLRPNLTRKQNFWRHGVPIFSATAVTLGALGNVATDGAVMRAMPVFGGGDSGQEQTTDESRIFEVVISPYPSHADDPRTFEYEDMENNAVVSRVAPNLAANIVSTEKFYSALPPETTMKGRLVLNGSAYPGPGQDVGPLSQIQRERSKGIAEAWAPVLKENGVEGNYWNYEKNNKRYGVWVEFELAKPVVTQDEKISTKLYVALNEILPFPYQSEPPPSNDLVSA